MRLRAIPGRLWVAAVLVGIPTLLLGWLVFARDTHLVIAICFGVAVALFLQLLRGHPLAREWGFFVVGLELAAGLVLAALAFLTPRWAIGAFVLLGSGGLLWWSLSGRPVRRYFGLYCRACGSYRARSRSFLFRRIGCRVCLREWTRDDPVESIFE